MKDDITLGQLPLTYRVLFTGFLLVLGLGLCMAGMMIPLSHGMADGKPGLSQDDIIYSFHGNRSGSRLETVMNGNMKVKAPPEAIATLIQWAHDSASAEQWAKVKPIMDQYCANCHDEDSGLSQVDKLEVAQNLAATDTGISIEALTRTSHIHLFGIGFIFLFLGWIFAMAEFQPRWKLVLLASPFAFLVLDIASWWLTKFWPGFAWLTMSAGAGYGMAGAVMYVTSLAQMWLPRWTQKP